MSTNPVTADCEGVKKGYRCHEERGFILTVRDIFKSIQEEEGAQFKDHLAKIDTSLEKMANSMTAFSVTVAQSEVRHEKNEKMFMKMEQLQDSFHKRLDALEVHVAVANEKARPFGWIADKVGTVIVTFIVTGILALVMIKGGQP